MAKTLNHVGIDVGSRELHVAFRGHNEVVVFKNDADGHKSLVRYIKKRGAARVVVEATGVYGLDVAMALHAARSVSLYYVNPTVAKGFSAVGLRRAKTDRVDAKLLAKMAAYLEPDAPVWQPPAEHALRLRDVSRRISILVTERTREKNRLHAITVTASVSELLHGNVLAHIEHLTASIDGLRVAALTHIAAHGDLAQMREIIVSTKGIADISAISIMGELVCLPPDLTGRQLVAQAGLDPRPRQSGMMDAPRSISRAGNKYLRAAMHMPAINGVKHCPEIRRFYEVLTVERKKKPIVGYVAVARKLLCTIHGMLRTKTTFDASKFYRPTEGGAAPS